MQKSKRGATPMYSEIEESKKSEALGQRSTARKTQDTAARIRYPQKCTGLTKNGLRTTQ